MGDRDPGTMNANELRALVTEMVVELYNASADLALMRPVVQAVRDWCDATDGWGAENAEPGTVAWYENRLREALHEHDVEMRGYE